jgi:hypothetical protein
MDFEKITRAYQIKNFITWLCIVVLHSFDRICTLGLPFNADALGGVFVNAFAKTARRYDIALCSGMRSSFDKTECRA